MKNKNSGVRSGKRRVDGVTHTIFAICPGRTFGAWRNTNSYFHSDNLWIARTPETNDEMPTKVQSGDLRVILHLFGNIFDSFKKKGRKKKRRVRSSFPLFVSFRTWFMTMERFCIEMRWLSDISLTFEEAPVFKSACQTRFPCHEKTLAWRVETVRYWTSVRFDPIAIEFFFHIYTRVTGWKHRSQLSTGWDEKHVSWQIVDIRL